MRSIFTTILITAMTVIYYPQVFALPSQYQKVLVVHSDDNGTDQRLFNNIMTALKTVKINCRTVTSESAALEKELASLEKDDIAIFATDNIPELITQSKIIRYVHGGGHIFFPFLNTRNESIQSLSGVIKYQNLHGQNHLTSEKIIFPGLESIEKDTAVQSYEVELDKTAEILMTGENAVPLSWKRKYGNGSVIVFNGSIASDATNCGMLLQLLALQNSYFLTTVFNAKIFFIDDFPSPVPLGTEEVVAGNYNGIGYEAFYRDIWWPEIKEFAKKYNLKYTCLALADYENSVNMPPPPFTPKMKATFKYYGEDILKNGHELGIHGYNHASLLMADYEAALKEIGYKPWKSVNDMETSLRFLRNALDETVGKRQYYSYVPPMNMLSKEGKEAILRVFPEMKSFAGLGDSTLNEPGVLYQDIGFDPDYPKVYALPRYSSGQVYNEDFMIQIYNYIAFCGVFSHFIHPDELFDSERSENKNWKELYHDLELMVKNVNDRFPFMRPMTANDFVDERIRTYKTEVYSGMSGNTITIEYVNASPSDPMFHYLRINDGRIIRQVENGKFTYIAKTDGLYLIEGNRSPVIITLEKTGK